MKLVNKQHIFLNSSNRVSGSSSDFVVNLDQNYLDHGSPDHSSMFFKIYISSFVCQNDFDTINEFTDSFRLNGSMVRLRRGKPNAYDLVEDLTGQLPPGATCSYNQVDNRLVFRTAVPVMLDFTLGNSAYQILGFDQDVYLVTDGFVSPNQINIDTSFDLLYIKSSFMNNLELSGTGSAPSRILASVPIITQPYSKIVYEDDGVFSTFIPSLKWLQNLRLSVTDYDGIPLPLTSQCFMTLTIETLVDQGQLILRELRTIQQELAKLKDISSLGVLGQSIKPLARLQQII
jgi:hypothetical protein